MATPLEFTANYAHSTTAVRAAFTDEQYWKDRLAEVGGPGAQLDSYSYDGTTLRVAMTQTIPPEDLPAAITAIKPNGLVIPRTETYVESEASGTFEAYVVDAPAQVRGTVTMSGDETHSRGVVSGTVEVTIPVFGKKIEKAVAEKLLELLAAEAEFTDNWIAKR
ncbi:DUF2505 domain-containing protein [Nocardia alni]|uniref:DUF2505 domain-containing protein n=1 Tax=Nocardia alni TaxID=2815723 RepID=UPI001C219319|nr:DUF2505 domain-containing protein [Nocardia alni]